MAGECGARVRTHNVCLGKCRRAREPKGQRPTKHEFNEESLSREDQQRSRRATNNELNEERVPAHRSTGADAAPRHRPVRKKIKAKEAKEGARPLPQCSPDASHRVSLGRVGESPATATGKGELGRGEVESRAGTMAGGAGEEHAAAPPHCIGARLPTKIVRTAASVVRHATEVSEVPRVSRRAVSVS